MKSLIPSLSISHYLDCLKIRRNSSALSNNTMSKSPVEVTLIPLGATLWLSIWLLLNLSVTLYNKAVMNLLHFSFPWLLTSIHMAFALAGSQIGASFGVFKPSRLSSKETWRMFGFSVLYTLNLAVSNISLNWVSIPVIMCPFVVVRLS